MKANEKLIANCLDCKHHQLEDNSDDDGYDSDTNVKCKLSNEYVCWDVDVWLRDKCNRPSWCKLDTI